MIEHMILNPSCRKDPLFQEIRTKVETLHQNPPANTAYADSLGWFDPHKWAGEEQLRHLEKIAKSIPLDAVLILIGVGGSNNGARAAIAALGGTREVYFAGNNLSAPYYEALLSSVRHRNVYINVIAKNFETLEPGLAFKIFRPFLKEKYGDQAPQHIIVTGTPGSHLHQLAEKHGYIFLTFPEDIGGRFSVLSDVGLFPMAFADVDIFSLVKGALSQKQKMEDMAFSDALLDYAAFRTYLYKKGYHLEMMASFDPRLENFYKWWIQLFAESEGKDGKGLYPVASSYSEDLHSVGQFVQEGAPILFETFLQVGKQEGTLILHEDDVEDKFDYLHGKSVDEINLCAYEATLKAHEERNIPIQILRMEDLSAYTLGELFYFFMRAVHLSGLALGVNPFNQPGVESYKKHMFELLGKH